MDKVLRQWNKNSVPYISVDQLAALKGPVLLDAREKEEFDISHLQHAIWVGDKTFNMDSVHLKIPDKNTPLIVYCSVGVRSEDIGEKLLANGYTHVKNLYGGIFEWKNDGYPIYDDVGRETDSIHAFSRHWGKLLKSGIKVYDGKNR
ncbi:rhodanese-like domain-containing protein [Flavobacteriaceae bacterium F89]|uniref:Rhodanese-like domain-containing protein n=1 Tax=Cerina litoralis TaxID=2874477 RepID=A0AAE3JNI0_9FLAO|nr:rhodanese-like domain-containing protein [Cerina litoralis]MCG2459899.1 rhodanese-like domain-containing protein [Cerina litoralis]